MRSLSSQHRFFRRSALAAALGMSLFLGAPASAEAPSGLANASTSNSGQFSTIRDPYQRLAAAAAAAEALAESGASGPEATSRAAQIEAAVEAVCGNLGSYYGRQQRVHGHEEPAWIEDRGDGTAQAVLALSALQRWQPQRQREERLRQLAYGLAALQRKDRQEYPFGAHLSWKDLAPFAVLDDGATVPSSFFQTARYHSVQALARASQVLGDKDLLASAERAALGMSTHLVIAGELLESFDPQPRPAQGATAGKPVVEGFLALHEATGKRIYSDLAALATHWKGTDSPEWSQLRQQIAATPSAGLLKARPLGEPNTFQIMEAEKGKVVNKAIETVGFRSPSGQPGELARMGRENTFWMRFDVPTEDEYLFYLTYLQSDVGGGLVSVMMRIDGDKIFQVPLGDVDGRPILRRKFVDGPRPLRAGPHSFGIRFSGLLMTKPALLDSVIVQPAIERREFKTPDGRHLVLLRNVTDEVVGTDKDGFPSWPPAQAEVLDGEGSPTRLGSEENRRRRKEYATLPPHGVALLQFDQAGLKTE